MIVQHVGYSTTVLDSTLFPTSDFKKQLNLPSTGVEDDTWLADTIIAARSLIERRVIGGLAVRKQQKKLLLTKFPTTGYGEIEIPFPPMISNTTTISVQYYDGNNNSTTLASSDIRVVNPGNGYPSKLYPAIDKTWPLTKFRIDAVGITFDCGSTIAANVEPTIKHAMKFLVTHWYENRSNVIVGTISKPLELTLDALLNSNSYGSYG